MPLRSQVWTRLYMWVCDSKTETDAQEESIYSLVVAVFTTVFAWAAGAWVDTYINTVATVNPFDQWVTRPSGSNIDVDMLYEIFLWILELPLKAITFALGWVTTWAVEQLLFFPNPADFASLNNIYWTDSVPIFFASLATIGSVFFLSMQLFPQQKTASVDRFMRRTFIAIILVLFFAGPSTVPGVPDQIVTILDKTGVFSDGLYPSAVDGVQSIGKYLYPDNVYIDNISDGGIVEAALYNITGGVAAILAAIMLNTGVLLTLAVFLFILSIRMLLVYAIYAAFPILMTFWVVDIGPAKYGKMAAGVGIKAAIYLLLIGVIISAMFSVGQSVGANEDIELQSEDSFSRESFYEQEIYMSDTRTESQYKTQTKSGFFAPEQSSGALQSDPNYGAGPAPWVVLFTSFATIGGAVIVTVMTLGSVVGVGFISQASGNTFLSRFTNNVLGGVNDALKGRVNTGPAVATNDTGDKALLSVGSKTLVFDDDGPTKKVNRSVDDFDELEEALNSDNTEVSSVDTTETMDAEVENELNTLLDKDIDQMSDTEIQDALLEAEADDRQPASFAQTIGQTADTVTAGGYSKGKRISQKAGARLTENKFVGGAVDVASLIGRGAKAYGRVFKQPTAAASVGEIVDIARESKIGHPGQRAGVSEIWDVDEQLEEELEYIDKSDNPLGTLKEAHRQDPIQKNEQRPVGGDIEGMQIEHEETVTLDADDMDNVSEEMDGVEVQRGYLYDPQADERVPIQAVGTEAGAPDIAQRDGEFVDIEQEDYALKGADASNDELAHNGLQQVANGDSIYAQVSLDADSEVN